VYVGPPDTPYKQPCIHCKAAEAIKPTLYCQPCLDALGQEWLRNYELGLLHSTLPAFFEAVAMIGAYLTNWRTLLGDQAEFDVYQTWRERWNQWLDGYSSWSEREVGK